MKLQQTSEGEARLSALQTDNFMLLLDNEMGSEASLKVGSYMIK